MVRALFYSFIGLVLFFFIALHPQEVTALINQFMHSISSAGQHIHQVQLQHLHQPTTTVQKAP